jgi:hypothetical protein
VHGTSYNDLIPGTGAAGHPAFQVGGAFLERIARRDLDGLADCVEPDVRVRAMVPPGPFELQGAEELVGRFRRWFGGDDAFELVDASLGEVGPRLYLRWRVRMTCAGPPRSSRVVEQHAFAGTRERIDTIDLLCSGFVDERIA